MSVILSLVSFLLVTAAQGRPHANFASTEGPIVPDSSSTVTVYWQAMLPNSPMPSAILELLTPRAGTKGDDQMFLAMKGDDQKFPFIGFGPVMEGGKAAVNMPAHGHNHFHGGSHIHGHFPLANLIFSEDVLTPGSKITPYILPAASRAPLLHPGVADAIQISTQNFADILTLFAPASLAMAGDIWSMLDVCEHPRPVNGEKQACATSIESMVRFAMSVLGTRDVRAFSPDVPAEGAASGRYKVAAVRAFTDSTETSVTCHDATFPFALFYCHAVNPTRVYAVTLESEEDGGGARKMEALAVCHLDTSQFGPEEMPRHLNPGDAAACHFISRSSVIWAPAVGTRGDHEQVAAAQ